MGYFENAFFAYSFSLALFEFQRDHVQKAHFEYRAVNLRWLETRAFLLHEGQTDV